MKKLRNPIDSGREDPDNAMIESISRFEGQKITLRGWVQNIRSSGKIAFLQLRDGTGIIQCVGAVQELGEEKFLKLKDLQLEVAVLVEGDVRKDSRSKIGFELGIRDIEIVSPSVDYPISKKGAWGRLFDGPPSFVAPKFTTSSSFENSC